MADAMRKNVIAPPQRTPQRGGAAHPSTQAAGCAMPGAGFACEVALARARRGSRSVPSSSATLAIGRITSARRGTRASAAGPCPDRSARRWSRTATQSGSSSTSTTAARLGGRERRRVVARVAELLRRRCALGARSARSARFGHARAAAPPHPSRPGRRRSTSKPASRRCGERSSASVDAPGDDQAAGLARRAAQDLRRRDRAPRPSRWPELAVAPRTSGASMRSPRFIQR